MNSDTIRSHAGHIGVILLCLWCIASGLTGTFHGLNNPTVDALLPIVLLLAGVLMLIGK